jgi:hypothetical protein
MSNNTMTTTTATTTTTLSTTTLTTLVNATISIITSTTTTLATTTTISNNASTHYQTCLQNYSKSTCRLAEFIRVLAYLLLTVSLLPQIIHLFNHGSRYIAGISYMWIVIRVLGLASLLVAHAFQWSSIFELIALVSTVVIFVQIFIYGDNLHRQQKVILMGTSVATWLVGGSIILLLRKREDFLMMTGYVLLAVHMLPQVK